MSPNIYKAGDLNLHNVEEEDHWISVSDLMAGLMMVFLFISIALMRSAVLENTKMKKVVTTYQDTQIAIYNALVKEFRDDLKYWRASIDKKSLSFEFQSPEVLFSRGKTDLKPEFTTILSEFFPRYMRVMGQFSENINEVRIEGHTSSDWNKDTNIDDAYFNNMGLSQGRTRAVLNYVYRLDKISESRDWIKKHIAAVGLSSSHLKLSHNGEENHERSRRVTFRIITNAEQILLSIMDGEQE